MPAGPDEWWPRLSPGARDWLVANNGDDLPASVAEEIVRAGGAVAAGAEDGAGGSSLPDEVVDRIEALANGEVP